MNRMPMAVCDRVGVERGQDWIGGSVIIDADGYPMAIAEFGRAGVIAASTSTAAPRYWPDGGARSSSAPTPAAECPP